MNARGFSLVELMLALGLGGLLVAAALSALATARQRHRESEVLARLHERASHAFTVLQPEIQLAGYGGLQTLRAATWPTTLPGSSTACGTLTGGELPAPVRVREARPWPLGCPPHEGGAVEGSDVLVITRASGRLSTPSPGRLQLLSRAAGRPALELVHDGVLPPSTALVEGRTELRDLVHAIFYVARRADGHGRTPALRLIELTEIAGRPSLRDTEVIDGVEHLRVEEGWRADDSPDTPLRFTRPGERPTSRPVLALRVHLRLRADGPVGPVREQRFSYAGEEARFEDAVPRLLAQQTFLLRNSGEAM